MENGVPPLYLLIVLVFLRHLLSFLAETPVYELVVLSGGFAAESVVDGAPGFRDFQ